MWLNVALSVYAFLGAGIILKEGSRLQNVTTASSIWFAAAIGMAYFFWRRGILGTIVVGMAVFVALREWKNGFR